MTANYINPYIVEDLIYFDLVLVENAIDQMRLCGSSFGLGFDPQEAVDRAQVVMSFAFPSSTLDNVHIDYPNGYPSFDWIG